MYTIEQIRLVHGRKWNAGLGSISAEEAFFLQEGVAEDKPANVIEIGTASGLSTGFLAMFMHACHGSRIISLDYDTTFWGDRSKETGYLAKEIYSSNRVSLDIVRGKTASCLPQVVHNIEFDLAFIDANHQHPWPTLDTICLLPFMRPGARVYHHDLSLYKNPRHRYGIGPKYLYDQIPGKRRQLIQDPKRNMYYIKTPKRFARLQSSLEDSLRIPWTLMNSIETQVMKGIIHIAYKYWNSELGCVLEETAKNYNLGFLDKR